MNMNRNSALGLELLTIVFVVLKLLGHIDWSWWWVLSPVWISFILVFVAILILSCWRIYFGWRQ